MKKKILASLVATMAVGATCAFAANPFVDVPTDSWAYKSVVELADAGIIQGVDGTYFQGSRNITRYEAAEMTAKAMAHMDKASVEQRAMINKLADEYADELNNLGVRVSNLEQKVGNIKMTGDFRIRYKHQSDAFTRNGGQNVSSDQFQYRFRLRANAYINDKTKAVLGVSTNNKTFFDGDNTTAASKDTNATYLDDAYVTSDLTKNINVKAGRWDLYNLGNGLGLQYGDVFEAMQGQLKYGNFTLTGGFGEFKEGAGYTGKYAETIGGTPIYNNNSITTAHTLVGVQTGYGELEGTFDKVGFGVYYNAFNDSVAKAQNLSSLVGGYVKFQLGSQWNLISDYQKVKKQTTSSIDDNANLWGTKLSYGTASFKKTGSWDAWLEYISADPNALYGSTNSWRQPNLLDNVKSWGVGVDYTIGKNVMFSVMQSFASSLKDSSYGTKDPNEETRAQFVFVF
jgi:hypothetical protein